MLELDHSHQVALYAISSILPFDNTEKLAIESSQTWVKSGVPIFRTQSPNIPPKHLVSYSVVVDTTNQKILLGDHIKSNLWLPMGGHVDTDEDPKLAALRECKEELDFTTSLINNNPVFISVSETVNMIHNHVDVSLWYILNGSITNHFKIDYNEFKEIRWFPFDQIPYNNTDKNMERFIRKLKTFIK
ncbi:MAG: NUDIX domain-containing protein [Alphaproteobacteria bacterium]|nr:NUDIX domain-containing protein [Alphaproteobacteria bacterium]OJV12507.1 MAG: hypothetical protein BGO27_07225 [Alphaproteobacteria bacterium 33-17]